ncbi:hypothetical protein MDA_GLEAN10011202 [Myotis davidii]|uniref:Uncharacterized protein n=1 Tax=Myotis davidii TaxID=225400 RepID=L5MG52_MYODS|nr:hypothetical protein MDA_GLEAN10011202 [Myotis davidii]
MLLRNRSPCPKAICVPGNKGCVSVSFEVEGASEAQSNAGYSRSCGPCSVSQGSSISQCMRCAAHFHLLIQQTSSSGQTW